MDPVWTYWGWNPKEKKQEKTDQHPLQTTAIQAQLALLEANIAKEGVLLNFRCTKDLEQEFQPDLEAVPFMLTIGLRVQEAHAVHRAFQLLSGNAVCKLIGARVRPERLARQPVAKQLEENYLATPYCPWSRRAAR